MTVLWLHKANSSDVQQLGRKATYLFQLLQKGLPVPRSCVIPPEALEAHIHNHYEKIEDLWLAKGIGASKEIQQIILREKLPESWQRFILHAHEEMDEEKAHLKDAFAKVGIASQTEPLVAVKSSYVLPASMERPKKEITLLNARTKGEVLEAVKHCWASLFSYEMLNTRKKNKWGLLDITTSVIIQSMVFPQKAGTITIEPNSSSVVITAGLGLGEAVVSKLVEGDTYVMNKDSLQLESKDIGSQEWRFVVKRGEGKIMNQKLSPKESSLQVLQQEELQQLTRLFANVSVNEPLEVEWCFEQGKFHMVNAWKVRKEPSVMAPVEDPQEEMQQESPVQEASQEVQPEAAVPQGDGFLSTPKETSAPVTASAPTAPAETPTAELVSSPAEQTPSQESSSQMTSDGFLAIPETQQQEPAAANDSLLSPPQEEPMEKQEAMPEAQVQQDVQEQTPEPLTQESSEAPVQEPPRESFLKMPVNEAVQESKEEAEKPFHKLYSKILHDASHLVLTCDMVVSKALQEKHVEVFGEETSERFYELIEKLSPHMEIPESVRKIRMLKNRYMDNHEPLDVAAVMDAMHATRDFIEKNS